MKISSRFRESQILWFFRWFPHINRFVDQNKWFPHISRFVDQTMKICEETDNSLKCERANIYINIAKHLRSAERDISASWFSTFWAFWTCFGGFYPLNSANVSPHVSWREKQYILQHKWSNKSLRKLQALKHCFFGNFGLFFKSNYSLKIKM